MSIGSEVPCVAVFDPVSQQGGRRQEGRTPKIAALYKYPLLAEVGAIQEIEGSWQ
jgi:hypothetical protein